MHKPMLLTDFDGLNATYPLWAERKFDGFRCIIMIGNFEPVAYSRNGNRLPAADEIARQMDRLCPSGAYDGELAGPTWGATQSAIKRGTPAGLVFHAFDHLLLCEWRQGYSNRSIEDRRGVFEHVRDVPGVAVVESRLIESDAEMEAAYHDAIARKWEGLVVKRPGSPYTCGVRSRDWQRLKPCRDGDSCE
jgi:bifunctional non-homologous end joining protein LigD